MAVRYYDEGIRVLAQWSPLPRESEVRSCIEMVTDDCDVHNLAPESDVAIVESSTYTTKPSSMHPSTSILPSRQSPVQYS